MGPRLLPVACCLVLLAAGCGIHSLHRPGQPSLAHSFSARYLLDGKPILGSARVSARSSLRLAFSEPVRPSTVQVTFDGSPLPPDTLAWSADGTSTQVPLAGLLPQQTVDLRVVGDPALRDPGHLRLTMVLSVPSNSTTGVGPGFQPRTPMEIVVENSPPARPQAGLQNADTVFEYLSEYSVTRMTAIYFNQIPPLIGPVRSCRMINPYLTYAYVGFTMCSGVSAGTAGWMFGDVPGSRLVPDLMDAFDQGGHYFRVGFNVAPHNLYTSADRVVSLRSNAPQPVPDYTVDPPHDDQPAGQPANAPSVPLHGVAYAYDAASRQYLRFDRGTAFVDQDTGQQVHAKTVVLMHVPFHDAGWVEDENGGAHSVWYELLGSGPADVYSDGQVVHATWHMGAAGHAYWDNHTPVWFTDETGRVLALNTGLTWIHVLGNGQERCPDSPAACG